MRYFANGQIRLTQTIDAEVLDNFLFIFFTMSTAYVGDDAQLSPHQNVAQDLYHD